MHESFKIGDKVICEGKLGRIIADLPYQVATDEGANVRFDGGGSTWDWAENIVHVSDVESERGFAVGDEVYVDFEPFFEPNMIYTISDNAVAYGDDDGEFAIGFEGTNMLADHSQLTHAYEEEVSEESYEEESEDISNVSVRVGIEGGEKFKSLADSVSELNDKVEIISNLIVELKEATIAVADELSEAIVVEPVGEPVQETKLSREEIVQRAIDYVEEQIDNNGEVSHGVHALIPEFIVDIENRMVMALLRSPYATGAIVSRGMAETSEDDVFNEHIGKAIALARALGEEVPEEFIIAPQPEQAEVGMVVASIFDGKEYELTGRAEHLDVKGEGRAFYIFGSNALWVGSDQFTIIDDSKVGGK